MRFSHLLETFLICNCPIAVARFGCQMQVSMPNSLRIKVFQFHNLAVRWPAGRLHVILVTKHHKNLNDCNEYQDSQETGVPLEIQKVKLRAC